jgi:hypothetical protein
MRRSRAVGVDMHVAMILAVTVVMVVVVGIGRNHL